MFEKIYEILPALKKPKSHFLQEHAVGDIERLGPLLDSTTEVYCPFFFAHFKINGPAALPLTTAAI